MKKRTVSMLLALGMVFTLAACGPKETTESKQPENSKPVEQNTDKPEDKGPSGKLVIYSPNSDTQINSSLEAFKRAYPGITVELQSMGTGDVLARIEAEKANPQADINWGAINYNFYEQHPDLWEEYVSPNDELLDKNYRNHAGYVSFGNLSGSGALILNDDLLAELGVEVKGYADLLNPKLKGKIAMGDPTASSSAFAELTNMLLVMGEGATADECYHSDKAWKYIEDFIANLDGIILSSSSAVYKNVVAGEYAVGVSYEDPVVQAVLDNKDNPDANISMVYPEEGAVWLPAGVAIVKNAPNMDNAKLFVDYMLSEECQKELAKTTIRGTITTIPQDCEGMLPFSEIKVAYEDQAAVAETGLVDIISSTLSGYTRQSLDKEGDKPDVELVRQLKAAVDLPVNGEGHIWELADLEAVLAAGADMVTIGSAVTRPHEITKRFVACQHRWRENN